MEHSSVLKMVKTPTKVIAEDNQTLHLKCKEMKARGLWKEFSWAESLEFFLFYPLFFHFGDAFMFAFVIHVQSQSCSFWF